MNSLNLTEKIDFDNIEKAFAPLISKAIWVISDIADNKRPINPHTNTNAKSNDPTTWGTLAHVRSFIENNPGQFAPAIALNKEIELTCIDLDHVCKEDQIFDWAEDIYKGSTSYCERSISGNGLHVFIKGNKPGQLCKKGQIEIYDHNKFITVTGNILPGHAEIKTAQEFLDKFYKEHFKEKSSLQTIKQISPSIKDSEVLSLCRTTQEAAKFKKLYDEGDISDFNNDASKADFHLCKMLAYFTQNKDQIFHLIKQSKLYTNRKGKNPDKWDRQDYAEQTIEKAINDLKAFYQPQKPLLKAVGLGQFLITPIPEKPFIFSWCREQNTIMIHAWRGIGKTLFALNVAYSMASGAEFLGWKTDKPRRVLYIDGEMPAIALQERLANIVKRNKDKTPPNDDYFQLIASDQQELGIPYLDTAEGQALLQPYVEKADVIIIDNLSTLTCQPENEAQAWLPMQKWMLAQRRAGKTIILIHHTGKGGAQRGSSKREDILDVVINLRRPKDYMPEQGARFELHFEKTRGISGKQVRPLEINVEDKNGILFWAHKELESAILDQIKELIKLGLKDNDIWHELEIGRATYYRYKKKLTESKDNSEQNTQF
ncbi:AAA family ATPase [Candidatus Protochlamydia phocaeensis]|uniref:phage NrS-1 polymerase family protein n=1 Tax=Candidatus Protochlamydia phocaeensis TaxID=1414722 RepID=UPI00083965DD|nr:AAA family ATPase [Candidatus Protochlamydia phocaeensis]